MTQRIGEEAFEDLIVFVEDAIDQILLREDETDFFAWVRAEAPRRFEEDFARLSGEQAVRATVFEIARELWNKIPLPGSGYRIRPIPKPERNDRCPCGSGQKHKRCCGAASGGRLVLSFTTEDGWAAVLFRKPPEEVAQVSAEGRVPRALTPGIAHCLLEMDAPEIALALLAPLFTKPESLTERDAPAIEPLIDALDALGLSEEKERLVNRLRLTLPPPLLLTLWESVGPSFAAHGETRRAWLAAEQIRRADPDSPVLGGMEVMLLLEENRLPEAADRARDALRRHHRKPGLSHEALALLRTTAADPAAGRREMLLGDMRESVDSLEKLLSDLAARPIRPYAVRAEELVPRSGCLLVPDDLDLIEDQWVAATLGVEWERPDEPEDEDGEPEGEEGDGLEQDEEDGGILDFASDEDEVGWYDEEMWASDRTWPAWLGWTPQAFDSLLVLSNLATGALMLAERDPALRETLLVPLVARGLAILDATLAGAPQVTSLPGGLEANAPALELLDISARLSEPDLDIKALERLLELDPEDSLSVRGELAVTYLKAGEPRKTLDLAACYTGDKESSFLAFARVIALHQLQRTEEAFATMEDALGDYPYVASMIATAAPLSIIPEALITLWRSEEELWSRLQKWLEEREPEEMDRLIGI
jgi:tetratricopeptide (TPR) repeat protein